MLPQRKKKLYLILFLVASVGLTVALGLYAITESVNLFISPTEIAEGKAPIGKTIRAGGLVKAGSVVRGKEDLTVQFEVTDENADLTIVYDGMLPDLFREGQGIVALGQLREDGVFVASEVLAKHDENYMPPEVESAVQKAHKEGREGRSTQTKAGSY